MKHAIVNSHPDVVLIYQDRDAVEGTIEQVIELKLNFTAYKFNQKKLHDIARMRPKILLLSSNDVKKTIQIYIDYLEEYGQNIAHHCAILLINNRESDRAYLACETGLFDNYVVINPLNEPHRLKLILQKELKIIEGYNKNSLDSLISEGEDELASCIEHGVALKNSFLHEFTQCEKKLVSATNRELNNDTTKAILQNIIGLSFGEMNESISTNIQNILEQLNTLKIKNQTLNECIEQSRSPKRKTIVGINTDLLTSEASNLKGKNKKCNYKILIAEPSDLFSRVIEEMFV